MWSDQIGLTLVGVSHHTAPLEVRERFACDEAAETRLQNRLGSTGLPSVLLSTCNRTELYLAAADDRDTADAGAAALSERAGMSRADAAHWLYVRRDEDVVRHLFRVTSGLDSLVVGEVQIQGQVRMARERAMARAPRRSAATVVLRRLFDAALQAGGRVRAETRLAEGAASVPSAALALARQLFGTLHHRRAVMLGTGEMSELALQCLAAEGVATTVVSARSPERARALAARHAGVAAPVSELAVLLTATDILLTATDAGGDVVPRAAFERARSADAVRPLLILDIAVPRDVPEDVGTLPGIHLHYLDDLRAVVDATLHQRRAEIDAAEAIVRRGAADYWEWHRGRRAAPIIRELRERAELLRQRELEKTLQTLPGLSAAERASMDALTRQLLAKVLHPPTARLREAAATGSEAELAQLVRYLFALDDSYERLHERRHDDLDDWLREADPPGAHG